MIEAEHMCMAMRGVRKPNTKIITCVFRGVLESDKRLRGETLSCSRCSGCKKRFGGYPCSHLRAESSMCPPKPSSIGVQMMRQARHASLL